MNNDKNNSDLSIKFSTKMCVSSIIVYLIKSDQQTNNKNNTINPIFDSKFTVYSDYSNENCGYVHQNSMGYCAESSIEKCRKCDWKGCSLIQCGNDVNKNFVQFSMIF